MDIIIRDAQPHDYMAIQMLIENELGYANQDRSKLCDRLERMKADERYMTIVAEIEGKIAGFIGLHKGISYNHEGEDIQIIALAVIADLQNKGIGSRLLKWAEEYSINNNVQLLTLTSRFHREDAHAFYEHNGYVRTSFAFKKYLKEH